ncbi:phage terminase large subunit [Campylobacter mucosalis]|uniref:phage terminase large subunit n=1 Tax=Campylobacter mucosalis TaxID=202 RepID=UPI00146FDAE2|nr:phage terminase large subunit [Campylobacter mucosalis]
MNLTHLPKSLIKQIRAELSRRSLIEFVTQINSKYQVGWFNQAVAKALEQFYYDVIAGKQPRLMIFAPPRSGKSELFSRAFPAWAFGKNPNLQIIASSYSADLSTRTNRDVQRIIMSDEYAQIFPNTTLNSKRVATGNAIRNSEIFEIVNHAGAYRSAGVGGGITGMGADMSIIDDPVKDAAEANSATYRDRIYDWYVTTLYTRLSPNSGVLLGMTRWHEDDLAGRLITEMNKGGDKWQILSFPAIAEQDEIHRKEGEALHPERYDLERILKIKNAIGSYAFNALYQQRPSSKGGDIIKGSWFNRFNNVPKFRRVGVFVDTAQKTGEHNDYSVLLLAGLGVDDAVYLLDLVRGKWDAVDLERVTKDFFAKHRTTYKGLMFYIEDKASGTGLIQKIKRENNIPVKAITPQKDKYTRVLGVVGYIESGYVYLPNSAIWVADFIDECEKFTATDSHLHDDQVDTLVMAIDEFKNNNGGIWGHI